MTIKVTNNCTYIILSSVKLNFQLYDNRIVKFGVLSELFYFHDLNTYDSVVRSPDIFDNSL